MQGKESSSDQQVEECDMMAGGRHQCNSKVQDDRKVSKVCSKQHTGSSSDDLEGATQWWGDTVKRIKPFAE